MISFCVTFIKSSIEKRAHIRSIYSMNIPCWVHLGNQHPESLLMSLAVPLSLRLPAVLMLAPWICFVCFWTLYNGNTQYMLSTSSLGFFYSVSYLCQCFFFFHHHISLSDYIIIYLPILFMDIWVISTILLINFFYLKKVYWKLNKNISDNQTKKSLAPAYLRKMKF